jgi:hypothetical protein
MRRTIRALTLAACCVLCLAACTTPNPGNAGTQKAQMNSWDSGSGGGSGY